MFLVKGEKVAGEKHCELFLQQHYDGTIDLMCQDVNGHHWYLMQFPGNGKPAHRYSGIASKSVSEVVSLNGDGCINVEN